MRYSLSNSKGVIFANNLYENCQPCLVKVNKNRTVAEKCHAGHGNRRIGIAESIEGKVFLCSHSIDDFNSSRIFRTRLSTYIGVLNHIDTIHKDLECNQKQTVKRLIHNLTSLNAHNIQEVYALVPQDLLAKDFKQQLKLVQGILKKHPIQAARALLRVAKNNLAMKSEFAVMRFLEDAPSNPVLRRHQIRKVVLNVLHAFFSDFTDHDVYVNVQLAELHASVDYDTFHVALYHIVDNAAKYIMPKSEMSVKFEASSDKILITFDMMSFPISANDLAQLGIEGYSGKIPKALNRAGDGVGLYRTKKLLRLNDASLVIKPNIIPANAIKHNGIMYQQNQFIIVVNSALD